MTKNFEKFSKKLFFSDSVWTREKWYTRAMVPTQLTFCAKKLFCNQKILLINYFEMNWPAIFCLKVMAQLLKIFLKKNFWFSKKISIKKMKKLIFFSIFLDQFWSIFWINFDQNWGPFFQKFRAYFRSAYSFYELITPKSIHTLDEMSTMWEKVEFIFRSKFDSKLEKFWTNKWIFFSSIVKIFGCISQSRDK